MIPDNLPAEFLHVKPGKGAAFVRSKLKNFLTGNTLEKTFRAGEPLEGAIVSLISGHDEEMKRDPSMLDEGA